MSKIPFVAYMIIVAASVSGCSDSRDFSQLEKGETVRVELKNGEFAEMKIETVWDNKLTGRGISIIGVPGEIARIERTNFWRSTAALTISAIVLQLIILGL